MEKKQKKEVLNPFHRLRNGCIIRLSSENSLWNCCFCEIREQTNNNLYQNIDIYMYFPANLPKFIENRAADENLEQTDNRKKVLHFKYICRIKCSRLFFFGIFKMQLLKMIYCVRVWPISTNRFRCP